MCWQTMSIGKIICFLSLVMLACSPAYAQQILDECTLSMGWEPWHPYQYEDEQGKLTGFDIDFIEAIASSIGCTVTYREINWARGLVDLKNGDLDLITNANFTEERSVWAHYSDAYRDGSIAIFMRKNESQQYPIESLADLKNTDFRLGIGRGVIYCDEVTELSADPEFKKNLVLIPTSELQQYNMLQVSRIDGFLRSITALKSLHELIGDDINLEAHPFRVGGGEQHVILSKRSVTPAQFDQFNEGLRIIQQNGVLDSLLSKYF